MAAYAQSLHHIIFSTRRREETLVDKKKRKQLYKVFREVMESYDCTIYAINGTSDHTHFLIGIHPNESTISLISSLKSKSKKYIRQTGLFENFTDWETGFATFSCHHSQREKLIKQILRQDYIHKKETTEEEYHRIVRENGGELI